MVVLRYNFNPFLSGGTQYLFNINNNNYDDGDDGGDDVARCVTRPNNGCEGDNRLPNASSLQYGPP